jgi:hypothetical protein
VECLGGRTSSSVQVEKLILLVPVQDNVEITVAEEDVASYKAVGSLASESFNLLS